MTSAFAIFETEQAQRYVLEKLTVLLYNVKRNNVNALSNQSYLLCQKHLLHVSEAQEASTICWQELHLKNKDLLVKVAMTAVVFAIIIGCLYLLYFCNIISKNYVATTMYYFEYYLSSSGKDTFII